MPLIEYFENIVKLLLSILRYLAAGETDAADVRRWVGLVEQAIDSLFSRPSTR